jgi:hypothetical protein
VAKLALLEARLEASGTRFCRDAGYRAKLVERFAR